MEIVEIRELEGPNIFLLQPAIKVELAFAETEQPVVSTFADAFVVGTEADEIGFVPASRDRVKALLLEIIHVLHDRAGAPRPQAVSRDMETPGHIVVAYEWERRKFAVDLAHSALDILLGRLDINDLETRISALEHFLFRPISLEDMPESIRRATRHMPIIGITGTNGKTTTTRLISAILMSSGRRVGWTSSSGVYIQGEERIHGDYTGPSGAVYVLKEPNVDVAVLETARGGILLRGLGYENNDVSVITNISPDHLGLQGVQTIEGLAEVKSTVARVTVPDGFAVLNADDALVLGMRSVIVAKPFLITRQEENPAVVAHIANGGWALTVWNGQVHWSHDSETDVVTDLNEIPITFGGRAGHMLENALCATAACLAMGLPIDHVRTGLAGFRPHSDQNRGRLNVFDVEGVTIIVDFAHNEAGLVNLLKFGRNMVSAPEARLITIIGSAGDRTDEALSMLGKIAADSADLTVIKDTTHYLRGRKPGEIIELMKQGMTNAGGMWQEISPSEIEGVKRGIALAKAGDVVAVMCIEDYDEILPWLEEIGTSIG
ncbi:MAG: Mur ligase family protein [Thermomicrobiales bacterium]